MHIVKKPESNAKALSDCWRKPPQCIDNRSELILYLNIERN